MRSTSSTLALVQLAAFAAAQSTCSYEELVPNRYTLASDPFPGWGTIDASDSVSMSGIAVAGGVPVAVFRDATGAVFLHRPSNLANRTAADADMTDAMYWTLPSDTVALSGMPFLTDKDAIVTSTSMQPDSAGIYGVLLESLSQIDPMLQGPGFVSLNCSLASRSCSPAAHVSCGNESWGQVHDYHISTTQGSGVTTILVATDGGLARAVLGGGASPSCEWLIEGKPMTGNWPVQAVTAAPGGRIVAGGPWRLWVLDEASGAVTHREWATNFTSGQGGAVSDAVTALAADWDTGVVYVGTLSALDVLYPNNTLGRVDGYGGLPYSRITSLALQAMGAMDLCPQQTGTSEPRAPSCPGAQRATLRRTTRLVIGSEAGVSIADVTPYPAEDGASLAPLPVAAWTWRYHYLNRYHTGPVATSVGAFGNGPTDSWPGGVDSAPAAFVVASAPGELAPRRTPPATSASAAISPSSGELAPLAAVTGRYGLSWIERQPWTLELKARRMRNIQTRHNRHGLVAECALQPAGNLSSCINGPSDNNGLWTSLVSTAYFIEHALTGSPRALNDAATFLDGLAQLNDVTGIKGLMARSCVSPTEPRPQGGKWFNSTAPGFAGWAWKGDTSSDEVAGQTFGFAAAVEYLLASGGAPSWTAPRAAQYLANIATYITKNGFILIDGDGTPTRWGDWSPKALNWNRSWTDERGVNSLEILALLSSAISAAPALPDKGASILPLLHGAWSELNNDTNAYWTNLRNLKIETPCDDNYSDDELTALPFYTWMVISKALPGGDAAASDTQVQGCLAGLDRWWGQMRDLRSDWWSAVTAGCAQVRASQGDVPSLDALEAAASSRWNLETWPLEMIEWTVQNSHREDIAFYEYTDRSGRFGRDSVRVLPANERNQGRWNGNPHDLDSSDGGSSEMDAGVFLLPYWKGRLHGLVA